MKVTIQRTAKGALTNALTIEHGGVELLYSYGTPIAMRHSMDLYLFDGFDYSNTTAKHIKKFTGYTPSVLKRRLKDG